MFDRSTRVVFAAALAVALFVFLARFKPEPVNEVTLPPDALVHAVATGDPQLFEAAVAERLDVNATDAEGRTPLVLATEQRDHALVARLLELGASVESAGPNGLTPLMIAAAAGDLDLVRVFLQREAKLDAVDAEGREAAHHAVFSRQHEVIDLLLESVSQLEPPAPDKPDLLTMACETEDAWIIATVLNRAPANLEWTVQTRRALNLALTAGDQDLTRLLLSKHPAVPTVEGRNIPLLAQAIVDEDSTMCRALLAAGADPNAVLPVPADKEFLKELPANLRGYVKADEGITPLMIAAGTGKPDFVRLLLDAGADRRRITRRYKMLALYFAVRTEKYKAVQMLLGGGPTPEDLRIEISLAAQRASVIKGGTSIFQTQCSTGREGFATPAGKYVITDKKRSHVSSIYKVEMPFFMRLNCLDFGMHAGVVPNRPASHGCIRLPSEAARKLFSEIPVGTVVMIN